MKTCDVTSLEKGALSCGYNALFQARHQLFNFSFRPFGKKWMRSDKNPLIIELFRLVPLQFQWFHDYILLRILKILYKKNKCNDFILVVKFWYTCTCIWSKRRWIYGTLHSNERIFWWLFVLLYFQYLHNLHPIDKSILVSQECLQACKTAKIKNREIIIRILFHFGNRKKV